jgi:uncharacterized protein involved in response to NO
MINIEKQTAYGIPLFRLGFRPFFLGAAVFAVVSVVLWMLVYVHGADLGLSGMSPTIWHAHEMIFGYAMAVIAGFLLTAIKNWTGQQTLRGPGLVVLFVLWLLARTIPLTGMNIPLAVLAVIDLLFMVLLVVAATLPVLKVKQYKQLGVISKLVLLLFANVVFYLGELGIVEQGVHWGLYSGLYMVMALMFVMARRVIPFFIEKGTDNRATVQNWVWVDLTSLVLLLALWIIDVFTSYLTATSVIAAMLFIVHAIRLYGWYTHGLWNKPLLWVLYLAYASLTAGFLLKASEQWFAISPYLSVHAFAYGGIGVMTIGMMSRVILGHTGRNVFEPPAVLALCFAVMAGGALVRVIFPMFDNEHYFYWIALSQLLWIASFLVFLIVFTPMLLKTRIDGRDG